MINILANRTTIFQLILLVENLSTKRPVNSGINNLRLPNEEMITALLNHKAKTIV